MRALQRLPEPQILIDKKATWLAAFINSGKKRPDSSKYAHKSIKMQLNSMSFHKCFYCETKLKDRPKEVDHHIEVSVDRNLAFEWTNLNLACDNCNDKIPHSTILITDALNPCINSDHEIQSNITFNDELIEPLNGSALGLRTIQKYRLDSEVLDTRRSKSVKKFMQLLLEIRNNQIKETRSGLTPQETSAIHSFASINHSFSLMFLILINKYNL